MKVNESRLVDIVILIRTLECEPHIHHFANDVTDLPDYDTLIKNPMCLTTIKQRINESAYSHVDYILADIDMMWTNCMLYNDTDTQIFKYA